MATMKQLSLIALKEKLTPRKFQKRGLEKRIGNVMMVKKVTKVARHRVNLIVYGKNTLCHFVKIVALMKLENVV